MKSKSGKLVLDKTKRKLIDSIFVWDLEDGSNCYSIHFVNDDETVWIDSISDIYMAIEERMKKLKKVG